MKGAGRGSLQLLWTPWPRTQWKYLQQACVSKVLLNENSQLGLDGSAAQPPSAPGACNLSLGFSLIMSVSGQQIGLWLLVQWLLVVFTTHPELKKDPRVLWPTQLCNKYLCSGWTGNMCKRNKGRENCRGVHQWQSQEGKLFSFSLVPCPEHPHFKLTVFVVQILTSAWNCTTL